LPLTRAQLKAKFDDCLRAGSPELQAQHLFDALMSLEKLPRARDLAQLLSTPTSGLRKAV
jgi:hypothetical protein